MPRLARLCAVLATLLALTMMALPSASAHDQLLGTVPAADSSVSEPPPSVQLSFNNAVIAMGSSIVVTGPQGVLSVGTPQVTDRVLSSSLPTDLQPGRYEVAWRAVSADGHPVDGTFAFTLTGASSPSATTTYATDSPTSSGNAAASPSPSSTAESGSAGNALTVVALVLSGGGIVVMAVLLVIVLRQRRQNR